MEGYTFTSATGDDIAALIEFCQANLQPEWMFCVGADPYPNADLMAGYIEAGNPFIIARHGDDIVGYGVTSRRDGSWLWGLVHPEIQGEELHEVTAHIAANLWKVYGEPTYAKVPAASDENIADELNSTVDRAAEIYETL